MDTANSKTSSSLNRRQFLGATGAAAAGFALDSWGAEKRALPDPLPSKLPRWRGFNLLEKFTKQRQGNPPFREKDFEWIADWGFNFARLPMSYHCWSDPADWLKIREDELEHIDQAVEFGAKYGVHVNMNFHRGPGYCVNPPAEPRSLWTDETALEACAFHWSHFARRFKGIPNARVSFDLLNEPADISETTYQRVVRRLVEAIRKEDPKRLIIADGLRWGNKPVPALKDLGIAQSTRGYAPMRISHHKASWVNGQNWAEPSWPLEQKPGDVYDKARLRREQIEPWVDLEKQGVGVHVGEWGAYNQTPHNVVLAWMRDCLDLWKEAGWGWALWNFRGSFGILDSGRKDVAYEIYQGHSLDRRMLDLIKSA